MAEFDYGDVIADSFNLVLRNLYIYVPLIISAIIGNYFSSYLLKLAAIDEEQVLGYVLENLGTIVVVVLLTIVVGLVAYGWLLALIGKIVKKGKAELLEEFGNGLRKAWVFFVVSIISIAAFLILGMAFAIFMILSGLITAVTGPLGIIFIILGLILGFVGSILILLAFLHIVPIIALQDLGPIETVRLSFEHFKENKRHSLALFVIIFLFSLFAGIIMQIIYFVTTSSFSNEAMIALMSKSPLKYSLVTFFASLPSLFISGWSFAFLTVSYVRKTGKSKRVSK